MYELFDHTADLGLRVIAPDRETLWREAAEGLFNVIVEADVALARPRGLSFALEAERDEHLLVDWLSELLYVFERERLVLGDFAVRLEGQRLSATARGRPLDPRADRLSHEVKAVTYHGLRLEPVPQGWLAEVILDI